MSTIGIVALSILAAMFLFALLGGVALLLWLAWRQKQQQDAAEKENRSVYAWTEKTMAANQSEIKSMLESAKASFTAIRNEVRTQQETHEKSLNRSLQEYRKELNDLLEDHRRQMQHGIEKINADALSSVAVRLTNVCIRTEKAIGILQQLVLESEKSPNTEYAPEAFAPEDSQFGAPPSGYGRSTTAHLDDQVDMVAQQELFTDSPAEV